MTLLQILYFVLTFGSEGFKSTLNSVWGSFVHRTNFSNSHSKKTNKTVIIIRSEPTLRIVHSPVGGLLLNKNIFKLVRRHYVSMEFAFLGIFLGHHKKSSRPFVTQRQCSGRWNLFYLMWVFTLLSGNTSWKKNVFGQLVHLFSDVKTNVLRVWQKNTNYHNDGSMIIMMVFWW